MLRTSLISALTCLALMSVPQAEAQRADIVQGVTSGELAATMDELRASNAELRARMTGIESDKARLNGKLETLEFLLSESRDEINRMQSDDAELERLITRLESRISDQEKTIADLNERLTALQPEPAFLSAGSGDSFADPVMKAPQSAQILSRNNWMPLLRRALRLRRPDRPALFAASKRRAPEHWAMRRHSSVRTESLCRRVR
ncbi:MAG: hypothetical protein AAGL09_07910 [Pseudomonadota bacterium]